MLGDALVPSNAKAGYLARMLARRVCRMKDDLGLNISLAELGSHHMDVNLDIRGFSQTREGILTILDLEEQRYHEMLRKVKPRSILHWQSYRRMPKKRQMKPCSGWQKSAESNRKWWRVSLSAWAGRTSPSRVGFAADMAERNAQQTKAAAKSKVKSKLVSGDWPATIRSYYVDTAQTQFEATVLHCEPIDASSLNLSSEVIGVPTHAVILDHTLFYPGGGQLGDFGTLGEAQVLDTHVEGDWILHLTDCEISGTVQGHISWERRKQLMDHHLRSHCGW